MDDQPTPTDEEHERTPEELPEHQAMQYPGHEDPELPVEDDEEREGD